MARTISKDTLKQKIDRLETAISKNRQQYDQLTKLRRHSSVHQGRDIGKRSIKLITKNFQR